MTASPSRPATSGLRRRSPSATAASCTCTATGCSPRSTRPRTRCRRRSCARGASRDTFDGGSLFRAWLYRIATNVCLDMLRRRSRRVADAALVRRGARGCSPTPTGCSTRSRRADDQPDAVVVERETIELAFLAALQVLPPRQRAALIARDVLGWPAERDRGAARHERGRGQQRAAAGPRHDAGAPAAHRRRLVGAASRAPRSGRCSSSSSTPTSAATPRPRSRSRRRTSASRCRPTRSASTGLDAIAPLARDARSAWSATATGGSLPTHGQPHADRRELPAPAGRHASSAPSSSTCCASRTARIAEITTFGYSLFAAFGLPPTL